MCSKNRLVWGQKRGEGLRTRGEEGKGAGRGRVSPRVWGEGRGGAGLRWGCLSLYRGEGGGLRLWGGGERERRIRVRGKGHGLGPWPRPKGKVGRWPRREKEGRLGL